MSVAHEIVVHFGRNQYKLPSSEITGSELRRRFGVPASEDLFFAQGTKAIEPALEDDKVYEVKNGAHFTSAPKHVQFGAE